MLVFRFNVNIIRGLNKRCWFELLINQLICVFIY